ncbi:JmjC domain-containing protein [Kribbella sp. NPDC020789]
MTRRERWKIDDLLGISADRLAEQRSRIHRPAQLDLEALGRLCTLADLDRILAGQSLAFPMVRCVRNGQRLSAELFTVPSGAEDDAIRYVDTEKLFKCFASGASIVVRDMHRYCEGLAEISWSLAEDLGCAVTVNGYLTPVAQQAFKPHFDYHDIVVVQIHGTKRWIEYDSNANLPLDDNNWRRTSGSVNPALPGTPAPIREHVLNPGDVLFVPRGGSHAVVSQDEATFHLTFELQQWTKFDVVNSALQHVFDAPALRESLPFGARDSALPVDPTDYHDATTTFLQVARDLDLGSVGWSLRRTSHVDMRETPVELVSQYVALQAFDEHLRVQRRPHILYQLNECPGAVELRTRLRVIRLPERMQPALRALMSGDPCSAAKLAESSGLQPAEACELVRTLLADATLVPA